MTFKNPANGYVEEVSAPGLWAFLFGFFYFAVKGVWTHAIVGFLLACCTLGLSWLVYPFFARGIMRSHYLKRGWIEVASDQSPPLALPQPVPALPSPAPALAVASTPSLGAKKEGEISWYVQHGDSEAVGPVATELLINGLRAGRVPLSARICPLGGKDWVPLATHPSFAGIVREMAPPPPPLSKSEPELSSAPFQPPPAVAAVPTEPLQSLTPTRAHVPQPFVPGAIAPPKPPTSGWFAHARARVRELPARERRVAAIILGSFCGIAVVTLIALFLLRDTAQPDYERCVKLEASGDLKPAVEACSAAVAKDPKSKSGKAAAARADALRATLARLLAEAQAAERARLLASTDPLAWLRLVRKYPDSEEAGHTWDRSGARGKILEHYTFCGTEFDADLVTELLGVTDKVDEEARPYFQQASAAEDDSRAQGPLALGLVLVAQHQGANARRLQATIDQIKAHPFLPQEADFRSGVLQDYATILGIARKWATLSNHEEVDSALSAYQTFQQSAQASGARLSKRITGRIGGFCAHLNDDAIIAGLSTKNGINDDAVSAVATGLDAGVAEAPPASPQPPAPPPPWPGSAWEGDEPPPDEVTTRAVALLPTLWREGEGSYRQELVAGRWITFVATPHPRGMRGVNAYRVVGGGTVPASSATETDSLEAVTPAGRFHAAHVLVQWAGSSDSKQSRSKEDALARAKEAQAKINAGEDFASVAATYGDDAAHTRAGDLGTFGPGTFPKPFETAVAGLEVGQVSDIVETRFGYHIIKRLP